ncbi:glutamate ligase domain-containing protein, partial [Lysobacter sp. 2RAB21]
DLTRYIRDAVKVSNDSPVLLDRFLDNAVEVDVDVIADREGRVLIGGVMEHIEEAGVHSGDSSCSLPPYSLSPETQERLRTQVIALAKALKVVGLMNTQFAIQTDAEGKETIFLIEVNPRASRTVPFVSKATGMALAKIAARCMVGQTLASQGALEEIVPDYYSVKEAIFPFAKFQGVDPILGPEMRSTGEVMGVGKNFGAAMARAQGWITAYSSTDGLFVDGERVDSGDYSGPVGARTLLRQPSVQAAILETARGGMLRRGVTPQQARAALVTNISPDHFGEYGIHSLEDLAQVKLTVARALADDGVLVLNADDALLLQRGASMPHALAWFALDDAHPRLRAHRERGGATCGVGEGRLWLSLGETRHDLGEVEALPLTLGGRARYNIANLAGAALAAAALGVAPERIAAVLARFGSQPGDNPGRLQRWSFGASEVYLDYAHNPDGLRGLLEVAARRDGRLGIVLGQAGNREDEDIRALAAVVASFRPDRVVLKDIESFLRGRAPGEVAAILRAELLRQGVPESAIRLCLEEARAAAELLQWAAEGDVLVLPIHNSDARDAVVALLDRLQLGLWRPGLALAGETTGETE